VGALGVAAVGAALAGCGAAGRSIAVPGAHPDDAPKLIAAYGCGSCHSVAGVHGADGAIGPSLQHFGSRRYIAGELPNTPANLIRWIMDPQRVEPGTVMPDMNVGESDARDIAAYLYRH
jgi:cytochrome c1